MPNSVVVLAHPRSGSFCHALADSPQCALETLGHDVVRHDLYAEGFDPVLPDAGLETTRLSGERTLDADALVAEHRRELSQAHTLVVVHPNWWGKPPAIMAGWMDRVLAPGVVYELDDASGQPRPLLALQRLVVLNTGDTAPEREVQTFGDPLELIWRHCVGAYLAEATVERMLAGPMAGSTPEQRARWLSRAALLAAGQ